MPSLSIAEIADRFPDFRVALVVAEDLHIGAARSAALAAEISAIEEACRKRWNGTELSAIPGVAAWRAAYKGFGIKRTSYRSSVERLIKRVLAGGALPGVNALVDLYNAASLDSELCLGCDDLDATEGDRVPTGGVARREQAAREARCS
jgi:DNA/RNA-binding domain of Phe-tRNA-synthetase-like protein